MSESGAELSDFFAAAGGRRAADAGALLVGRGSGVGAAVCAGGLDGAAACGGSEFMMLAGGIDGGDGKVALEPDVPVDASGRVRVGQFTA